MQNELLLIPDKPDEERDAIARAWDQRGGTIQRIGKFWIRPDTGNARVSIYGNDSFALVLAQLLGIQLLMPKDEVIAELPQRYVKRKIEIVSAGERRNIAYPKFIKPVQPKLFKSGGYTSAEELSEQLQGVKDTELLLCSEIISVETEVRAFILDNTVKDLAYYEGSGELDQPMKFIEEFLANNTFHLPKTFVIDIGCNGNSGWFIIEFNSSWGAGLNGCNAKKVLDCIREAAQP